MNKVLLVQSKYPPSLKVSISRYLRNCNSRRNLCEISPSCLTFIHQFHTNGFPLPAPICLFSNRDLSYEIPCFPLGIFFTRYIISFYLLFWLPPNTELIRKQVLFPKASVLRSSGLLRSRILCVNCLPCCASFYIHLYHTSSVILGP